MLKNAVKMHPDQVFWFNSDCHLKSFNLITEEVCGTTKPHRWLRGTW